ncbi:HNH endonuclease signature motif containing protein [Oricola sp.]|uniref:HNH endonuclease signature motif containing protein n=1 Tax=Oricola sp. TaxID=1979950 RepID=UPI0035145CAF
MAGLLDEALRKVAVWNKATSVIGYDPTKYRKDRYGAWIAFDDYSKCTDYGWEIDHIHPSSLGGPDYIGNFQPLHWRNNTTKSNRLLG